MSVQEEKNIDDIANETVQNNVTSTRAVVRRFCKEASTLKDYLLTKYPSGFDFDNLLDVIVVSIQYLSIYRKISGHQKRNIIIEAILLVLDETDSGSLEVFEPVLKAMVPATVNTLIDVEKKKIKLNKKATGVLWRCFCC